MSLRVLKSFATGTDRASSRATRFRASSSCAPWTSASAWTSAGTSDIRERCRTPWDAFWDIWILDLGDRRFSIVSKLKVEIYLPMYRTLHFGQKYRTFPLKSTPRVSASRTSSSLSLWNDALLRSVRSEFVNTWLIVAWFSRFSCLNWSRRAWNKRTEKCFVLKFSANFSHCKCGSIQRFFKWLKKYSTLSTSKSLRIQI